MLSAANIKAILEPSLQVCVDIVYVYPQCFVKAVVFKLWRA